MQNTDTELLADIEEPSLPPAPYWRRLGSVLADLFLSFLLIGAFYAVTLSENFLEILVLYVFYNKMLAVILLHLFIRFATLYIGGRTPGMFLFRIVLRNGADEPLTREERLLAGCFVLYRGVDYYLEVPNKEGRSHSGL